MTIADLQALTKVLRELGIVEYRDGQVVIRLGPLPATEPVATLGVFAKETSEEPDQPVPSLDELETWSSGS